MFQDVEVGSEMIHVDTVYDVLDKMCRVPERPISAPMRMPISGIYKIKGAVVRKYMNRDEDGAKIGMFRENTWQAYGV